MAFAPHLTICLLMTQDTGHTVGFLLPDPVSRADHNNWLLLVGWRDVTGMAWRLRHLRVKVTVTFSIPSEIIPLNSTHMQLWTGFSQVQIAVACWQRVSSLSSSLMVINSLTPFSKASCEVYILKSIFLF